MNSWTALAAAAAAGAFSWLLTGLGRRHALRAGMLDVPGERSSHQSPTPRGGGIGIGLCVLGGCCILWLLGGVETWLAAAMAPGAAVMLAGWLDDRRGLPAPWRALVYLGAAAAAVFLLRGGAGGIGAGDLLAVVALAWLINLYNFMDGTDALAGVQCVTAAVFAAYLFNSAGAGGPAWLCLLLAASAAGFLPWNWPPARIFMGDTGSCFIGFAFGVLALAGAQSDRLPLPVWFILLSLFIVDATLTLARRVLAGERWYSPHRTHAYQLLVHAGMSHQRLALLVLGVNCLLLGPLAVWSAAHGDTLIPAALLVLAGTSIAWAVIQARLLRARDAPGRD